jgi:hypothetical protein
LAPERIEKADLQRILSAHRGNASFAAALERAASGEDLLRVLGRYVHFNSVFGAGVANLAGELAVRQDLFRDPAEPAATLGDRSVEVAAAVFFAAIDEFGDRSTPRRNTHRSLTQATLRAAGEYFGYRGTALDDVAGPDQATLAAIKQVCDGYGLDRDVEEPDLLRGLGFHMSSEILADEEFRLLDRSLRNHHPELVNYLQQAEVEVAGDRRPAYFWIQIHTTVEADHFDFAARAANLALCYYSGQETPTRVKDCILGGFRDFAASQAEFMEALSRR